MAKYNLLFEFKIVKEILPVFILCAVFLTKGIRCDTQKLTLSNEIGNSGASGVSSSSVSAGGGNNGGDQQQYRYYYPVAHNDAGIPHTWNRDSYATAAAEFSNNYQPVQQGSAHSSSFFPASEYGVNGDNFDFDGLGLGGAGLGGLGGLAGILGIKGLKGLGLFGLLKLLGLPLLLLAIPVVLLLPLLLAFIPFPVITLPANANIRSMGAFNFSDMSGKMTHLTSVLDSDKCIERLSCEMSSLSRGSLVDRVFKKVIYRFETHMPQTLKRMARAYMDQPSACKKKYSCYLVDENSISKKST